MRERSELLQLDLQRYPLLKQVLAKRQFMRDEIYLKEKKKMVLLYLELLLQFTIKPSQHCICLLVSSD